MSSSGSNAQRFLNAFAEIERILSRQHNRRVGKEEWVSFVDLVKASDALLWSQKEKLYHYAKLRNAIAHTPYLDSEPIADPRSDTVKAITKIHQDLEQPPLLVDALSNIEQPRVFNPAENIDIFLELVTAHNFSQAPVKVEDGFVLLTTNAVARWFSYNLIENSRVIETTTPIREVLDFAETGDRLKTVVPTTTTIQAINLFSGQAEVGVEPPAALLLLGKMGQPPQRLAVRADLSLLYAQLQD